MLNKENAGIVVGMITGDACIPNSNTNLLKIWHSQKQEAYVAHKRDLLGNMFGKFGNINHQSSLHYSGNVYHTCGFGISHPYFTLVRNQFYQDGKKVVLKETLKQLTPEGIAIWFMDDGTTGCRIHHERGKTTPSSVYLELGVYCSSKEASDIQEYFREVWDISPKARSTGKAKADEFKWCINFNTTESKKLAKIINPYIISTMSYKMRYVT